MLTYLRLELKRIMRNRRFVLFTFAMPVTIYLLFTHVSGSDGRIGGTDGYAYLMVSMATYSAITGAMSAAGPRLAQERASGWVRQLRTTPLPARDYLATKVLTAMAVALPSVLLLAAMGLLANHVRLPAGHWLTLIVLLWVGTLPFAALGILLAYLLAKESVQGATVLLLMALALLGGLWTPLPILPHTVQMIGHALPTYQLGELGWRTLAGRSPDPRGVAILAAYTLAFAALAAWRYRLGGHPPRRNPRLWASIWLLYLLFPIVGMFGQQPSAARLAGQIALLVLFFAGWAYALTSWPFHRSSPQGWVGLGAVVAAAAGLTVGYGPGWDLIWIYVNVVVLWVLPWRWAVRGILVVVATAVGVSLWQGLGAGDVFFNGFQTALTGIAVYAFVRVSALNNELREAHEELARMAVAEERLRFARDLHDLLGHSLSVVVLKSRLAGRLLEADPARAAAEVRDIEQVASRSLAEVREAVSGYRRVELAAELVGARAALETAGIGCLVDAPPSGLPSPVEEVLGWTVREGTTNVIRHSGATTCRMRFWRDGGTVVLELDDDGHGGTPRGGRGLAGLAERVAALGGRLQAGQRPERGFRLRVELPLQAERAAAPSRLPRAAPAAPDGVPR